MRKVFTLLLLVLYISIFTVTAQSYNAGESALGIRGGGVVGITYKHFPSRTFVYEAIVSRDFDKHFKKVEASFLLEKLAPLIGNRFAAQIGLGPSYIFDKGRLGVAGTLGFDWRMTVLPFNVQVDWMPAYYFINEHQLNPTNAALSLRYILNHGRKYRRENYYEQPPPAPATTPPVK
jgi:hypothetical protein